MTLILLLTHRTSRAVVARLVPQYGLEFAYARNGQRVLRIMHEGVRRGAAGTSPSLAPIRDDDELDELETMLPWLPAYDRRDALVVWRLLRVLSDKHKRRAKSVSLLQELDEKEVKWALAASCFTAALTKPSPGDPVGSLDVKEWLQQKGIEWPEGRRIRDMGTVVACGRVRGTD